MSDDRYVYMCGRCKKLYHTSIWMEHKGTGFILFSETLIGHQRMKGLRLEDTYAARHMKIRPPPCTFASIILLLDRLSKI